MSKKSNAGAGRKSSGLRLSEWSLRRKVALALAIPMGLAAVFGGLRVQTELDQAANYSATARQVTVLRPAVAYLVAAENAAVVARRNTAVVDPDRDKAIEAVTAAGAELESARSTADLTPTQLKQVNSVLDLSAQLRTGMGYVSIGQSVAQVRLLHRNVTALINTIVAEQIEPEPRLQILSQTLDGRVSLSMQQLAVAYGTGDLARPRQLAAEIGIESSAIERLGVALGATDPLVLSLRQQNALHFGTIRENGRDLGDETAFEGYDQLSANLLGGIDAELTRAADESRNLALVNSAVTLGTLLAAIILALLISRLLLNPIRRVRDGALLVAREQLPKEVARIRAGGDPGEIVPIDVTTREEMGQLARAVDDLHRQAVHLASGEAKLKAQVGDMFVTLSRRNTSLINQQLALIETLERDEEDPQRLESLFRLDHLASRMRRTAESLMVLADAPTQSVGQDGISVADSLHAATAGVQDYQRVQILSSPTERISPTAATDVVHLVTELIDNALTYSPPSAPVLIDPSSSPAGTILQINDAGLGITQDALAAINEDLRAGGEVTPDSARRMGLLVVGRLARRHGISVRLDHNDRGGTTATVLLPPAILSHGLGASASPAAAPTLKQVPEATAPDPKLDDAAAATVDQRSANPGLGRIQAVVNAAALGLPQRQPGASGVADLAAAPKGGSLLQRLSALDVRPAADFVQRQAAASGTPIAADSAVPDSTRRALEPPRPLSTEPDLVEDAPRVTAPALALAPALAPAEAEVPAGVLDAGAATTDSDDDSPIFLMMSSNWLSSDGAEQPWASSDVEAGWEAADRVAETPTPQLSEGGLPMRRPGSRLVPGGVAPVPTGIVRDPEAIRKRLAAHAAGVSRGRAAIVEPVPADLTQKEAGHQ